MPKTFEPPRSVAPAAGRPRRTDELKRENKKLRDDYAIVAATGVKAGTLVARPDGSLVTATGKTNEHMRQLEDIHAQVDDNEREQAQARILEAGEDAQNTSDSVALVPGQQVNAPSPLAAQRQAMGAIERHSRNGQLATQDADRLSRLVTQDLRGHDSAYIAAISDPYYEMAFAKVIAFGQMAAMRLEPHEGDALRAALRAHEIRGYADRGGGGFSAGPLTVGGGDLPLPISVDPTIQLANAGNVSPIREDALVVPITTATYRMGTSQGMTAAFADEGEEVQDSTPLVDPTEIVPQRAHAFAEFTIEAQQDWESIQDNLATMLLDAKNSLEATAFLTGAGELAAHEPEGILTALAESDLGELGALDLLIATQNVLEPRYQTGAKWYGSLGCRNLIDQLVAAADPEHARITDDTGNVLHRPWRETSDLAETGQEATPLLIYGDLRQAYRIVDRVGMSAEVIPHMMGSNGRPRGVRGLYAFWRVSAKVVNPEALIVVRLPEPPEPEEP